MGLRNVTQSCWSPPAELPNGEAVSPTLPTPVRPLSMFVRNVLAALVLWKLIAASELVRKFHRIGIRAAAG